MTPYWRTALYYATQFLPVGAAHAFAGIWLSSHGLSGVQIGAVGTVPIIVILIINTMAGRLADRAKDWRTALQLLNALFVLFCIGLFWANNFWLILLCFTGFNVAGALAATIGDAAALHLTSQGRGHIGTLRGLATAGYIGALFATGYLASDIGPAAFVYLTVGFGLFRLLITFLLPPFKHHGEKAPGVALAQGYRALLRPRLFMPLASWALMNAAIQVLNSFLALHFKNEGYDAVAIGWLIAIGAFTEVLMFFAFRKMEHWLDPRLFIVISGVASILRWSVMALSPGLPVLVAMQALHGLTYALGFVACVTYISRNTSSQEAAEIQGFFNVVQQVVAVLFVTGFSAIFDRYGASSFFFSTAMAAAGTVLMLISYLKDHKNQGITR